MSNTNEENDKSMNRKWDAKSKADVLLDYMFDPVLAGNVEAVARKWNVPSETVLAWLQKELERQDGKNGIFDHQRELTAREINYRAMNGARNVVTQMQQVTADGTLEGAELLRYADMLIKIASKVPVASEEDKKGTGGVTLIAEVMDNEDDKAQD
jgi:transposase-like protein